MGQCLGDIRYCRSNLACFSPQRNVKSHSVSSWVIVKRIKLLCRRSHDKWDFNEELDVCLVFAVYVLCKKIDLTRTIVSQPSQSQRHRWWVSKQPLCMRLKIFIGEINSTNFLSLNVYCIRTSDYNEDWDWRRLKSTFPSRICERRKRKWEIVKRANVAPYKQYRFISYLTGDGNPIRKSSCFTMTFSFDIGLWFCLHAKTVWIVSHWCVFV